MIGTSVMKELSLCVFFSKYKAFTQIEQRFLADRYRN